MKIDSDWFLNVIANHAPNLRFRICPPPAPKDRNTLTWSGGFSWVIPSGSKNPRMAFELIRFLMTDRIWLLQNRVDANYWASRGRHWTR